MAKYTPGPWEIFERPSGGKSITMPPMSDGVRVTIVPRVFSGDASSPDMQNDNIRLIAAAPELLEAAQACWAEFEAEGPCPLDHEGEPCWMDMVQAAIAKATESA